MLWIILWTHRIKKEEKNHYVVDASVKNKTALYPWNRPLATVSISLFWLRVSRGRCGWSVRGPTFHQALWRTFSHVPLIPRVAGGGDTAGPMGHEERSWNESSRFLWFPSLHSTVRSAWVWYPERSSCPVNQDKAPKEWPRCSNYFLLIFLISKQPAEMFVARFLKSIHVYEFSSLCYRILCVSPRPSRGRKCLCTPVVLTAFPLSLAILDFPCQPHCSSQAPA